MKLTKYLKFFSLHKFIKKYSFNSPLVQNCGNDLSEFLDFIIGGMSNSPNIILIFRERKKMS